MSRRRCLTGCSATGLSPGQDNEIAALAVLPEIPRQQTIDELAADYAAIYLNNSLSASPCESVWFDDDHPVCRQPIIEWRRRFDDHLVLKPHYLRHVLQVVAVDGRKMANFIDGHIGCWFPTLRNMSRWDAIHRSTRNSWS